MARDRVCRVKWDVGPPGFLGLGVRYLATTLGIRVCRILENRVCRVVPFRFRGWKFRCTDIGL